VNLVWSEESIADRMSTYEYIAANNVAAAEKLDTSICDRADSLTRMPQLGRPGKLSGTRELTIHPNYRLVYRIDGDAVILLRVIHASRNWPQ
jgi:toxin ParE1/3/4